MRVGAWFCTITLTAACGGRAFSPSESDVTVEANGGTDEPSAPVSERVSEQVPEREDAPPRAADDEASSEDETIAPDIEMRDLVEDEDLETVLELYCGACHGAQARASNRVMGNLGYIDDLERLVDAGYLVPLDSARSEIVRLMQSNDMPPRGARPRPSRSEIRAIAAFIDDPRYY